MCVYTCQVLGTSVQKGRQKRERPGKEAIKRWLCVWGRGAGRRTTLWCLFHDGCTFSRKDQENSNKDSEARSMQYRTRTESNKQENVRTHTQQQKQMMRISFREFGPPLSASQLISLCVRAALLFFLRHCTNAKDSALLLIAAAVPLPSSPSRAFTSLTPHQEACTFKIQLGI